MKIPTRHHLSSCSWCCRFPLPSFLFIFPSHKTYWLLSLALIFDFHPSLTLRSAGCDFEWPARRIPTKQVRTFRWNRLPPTSTLKHAARYQHSKRTSFWKLSSKRLKSPFCVLNRHIASFKAGQRLVTDGRFENRIPVGSRLSANFQTDPGAHPASYIMGTRSFPGVKRPGRGGNHPPHLTPKLKKEYNYTSTPLLGFHGLLIYTIIMVRGTKLSVGNKFYLLRTCPEWP